MQNKIQLRDRNHLGTAHAGLKFILQALKTADITVRGIQRLSPVWVNAGSNGGEKRAETFSSVTMNDPRLHPRVTHLEGEHTVVGRRHTPLEAQQQKQMDTHTLGSTCVHIHTRRQLCISIRRLLSWAISFHLILWHGNELHFVISNCNWSE